MIHDTAEQAQANFVHANGIDIHYVETGAGQPLVLLHGGMVSTNPIWAPTPVSYAAHMQRLGERFHVIAPDTRGCGRTRHTEGTITYDLLADDLLALIDALGLDRPALAGFSDGGIIATTPGIRSPGSARAIVNDAGFDFFNPQAPRFTMMRRMLGGGSEATEAGPDAAAAFFKQSDEMRAMFELLKADADGAHGDGHWREYLRLAFPRTTVPPGYTFEDLGRIIAPTLFLVGDRDPFCTVEEGVTAYRGLKQGELAVLPDTGHLITAGKIESTINFLQRHS